MVRSYLLIQTLLQSSKAKGLPLAYAADIAAKRMFVERIPEDELKLCADICVQAARLLPSHPDVKAVIRAVERGANTCRNEIISKGLAMEYIGGRLDKRCKPCKMVVYLATYTYFGKPYYQMIKEHPEMFTGQNVILK